VSTGAKPPFDRFEDYVAHDFDAIHAVTRECLQLLLRTGPQAVLSDQHPAAMAFDAPVKHYGN
jgi:hypothetical protein